MSVTASDVTAARAAVEKVARRTPILSTRTFSERAGGTVVLKAENLQRTGSFKVRGVAAKLAALGDGCNNGVVAASAGNHGQALAAAAAQMGIPCEVFVPSDAILGGYYAQSINKDAPHPAAARLWQEYLFSDEGQNLWLKGGARPVRMPAMIAGGTIDKTAAAALPTVSGTPVFMSDEQATKAKAYLADHWAKAIA